MLIKVKTLTGKEIEIDIEPNDKVERIKERVEEKVRIISLAPSATLIFYSITAPRMPIGSVASAL